MTPESVSFLHLRKLHEKDGCPAAGKNGTWASIGVSSCASRRSSPLSRELIEINANAGPKGHLWEWVRGGSTLGEGRTAVAVAAAGPVVRCPYIGASRLGSPQTGLVVAAVAVHCDCLGAQASR